MLDIKTRKYKKQYVIGGSGIFDTVKNFFGKLFTSNAARQAASTALSVGKSAAKDVMKEVGKNAVEVGKTAAIDAGKKLVEKIFKKPHLPISQPSTTTTPLTKESESVLAKLIADGAAKVNVNNLMMGSGSRPIKIQDLVRGLNKGAGVKITTSS